METDIYVVKPFDEFEKQVKRLTRKKRFFSLPQQVKELREKLEKGDFDEPPIFHLDEPMPIDVYKVRLPNSDTNEGKSNGYRVVYMAVSKLKVVVILTIYYKKEQADATDIYIKGLIDGFFLEYLPDED